MPTWSGLHRTHDSIEQFKAKFGVEEDLGDTFANNEELLAKMQAGASGYDIIGPTGEYIPALRDGGYIQPLDKSRSRTGISTRRNKA
ncbi:MAG: hypothetical protein U0838_10385 [Chloroflexota bacterium]